MKKYLLIIFIYIFCLFPLLGAKPGDTIGGAVAGFDSLSYEKQSDLIVDGQLAHAAYSDGVIPSGYRAATRAEFNKYIGLTSQKNLSYNSQTGHFQTVGVSSDNGLAGSLLINENDGSIVVVFRGSEASVDDWTTNVSQGVGGVPEQYSEASEILTRVIQNTTESKQSIKVVGHSLGGGLATYATLNNDTSRVTTTTFNAAGIYPTNINNANLRMAADKITNIRIANDPVSAHTGLLIGTTYEVDNLFEQYVGNAFDKIWSSGNSHKIGTTILYMKSAAQKTLLKDSNKNDSQDSNGDSVSSQPDNNPNGDNVVSNDNNGGDNSSNTPSGDSVVNGDEPQSGSGNSNNTLSGDDVSSGTTDTQIDWEHNSDDDTPAIGNVLEKIKENSPIVGPNIPHYRVLWIFAGENWADAVKAAGKGIGDLISNIKEGNISISSISDSISDEMGFKDMKAALESIGD